MLFIGEDLKRAIDDMLNGRVTEKIFQMIILVSLCRRTRTIIIEKKKRREITT